MRGNSAVSCIDHLVMCNNTFKVVYQATYISYILYLYSIVDFKPSCLWHCPHDCFAVCVGSLHSSDGVAALFFPCCILLDVVRRDHHLPIAGKSFLQWILQEHAILCCHRMGYEYMYNCYVCITPVYIVTLSDHIL